MSSKDDFASFMENADAAPVKRLRRGQVVEGPVVLISKDSVFIDLGSGADGRVPRLELEQRDGSLKVVMGDVLKATVVQAEGDGGPLLAVTLGKDSRLDVESLELAMESETPIEGVVSKAVKGGLEVDLNGGRAFCPASQVDRSFVSDLETFVGQSLRFVVIEVKEEGRTVILSRRKVLEQERAERAASAQERLKVGDILEGKVSTIQRYGAFVDLDGVEGLIHISELSSRHVDRVEDVLQPGESVQVKILEMEQGEKGPRIKLSMKALQVASAPDQPAPSKDEVLQGEVLRLVGGGVIVRTPRGEGLIPLRELGLPPGADHRRSFAVEQKVEVALLDEAGGRLRFSVQKVDEVLERTAYRNYKDSRVAAEKDAAGGSLASQLGQLKLGKLPPGPPPAPPAPKPPPPAKKPAAPPAAKKPATAAPQGPEAISPSPAAPAAQPAPTGPAGSEAPTPAGSPSTDGAEAPPTKKRRRIIRPGGQG